MVGTSTNNTNRTNDQDFHPNWDRNIPNRHSHHRNYQQHMATTRHYDNMWVNISFFLPLYSSIPMVVLLLMVFVAGNTQGMLKFQLLSTSF
jgi:hypothetical protein